MGQGHSLQNEAYTQSHQNWGIHAKARRLKKRTDNVLHTQYVEHRGRIIYVFFVSPGAGARVSRAALVLFTSFRNTQQTTEELKV